MDLQSPSSKTSSVLRTAFTVILFLLTLFHMLCCTFRDIMKDYGSGAKAVEQWITLILFCLAVLCILIAVLFFPRSRSRIRASLRLFSSYEQVFLLILLLWAVLSCWLNQRGVGIRDCWKNNDRSLYEYFWIALVFFPFARYLGPVRARQGIETLIRLVLLPYLLLCAWMLWNYLHGIEYVFPTGWKLGGDGAANSFSYGVNRNFTGSCMLTMFVLCLYFAVTRKGLRKMPYLIGIPVFAFALILTNCRTAWYSALLTVAVFGFLLGRQVTASKPGWVRFVVPLVLSAACAFAFYWLRIGVFLYADRAISAAKAAMQPLGHTAGTGGVCLQPLSRPAGAFVGDPQAVRPQTLAAVEPPASMRTYETGLSGRMPIYKASFVVMFSRKLFFLFGVTPYEVGPNLYGVCGVTKVYGHAHNLFLQTGVALGVPAMIGMILFVISLGFRSIRLYRAGTVVSFSGAWMLPLILLCLLAADMMESFLAASEWGPAQPVFYLMAGWLTAFDSDARKKSRNSTAVQRTFD